MFTPGPWHTYTLAARVEVLGPNGEAVAACRPKYRTVEHAKVCAANAQLCAAAPAMLAALIATRARLAQVADLYRGIAQTDVLAAAELAAADAAIEQAMRPVAQFG